MLYQKKLVQKQNMLNRFVDIGTGLLAISCACSYAASLYKKAGKKNSLELADLFCRDARGRIADRFKEISRNDDRLSGHIAKKLMVGYYEWLENDIIKKEWFCLARILKCVIVAYVLSTHKELAHKLNELERKTEKHDTEIQGIFEAIRQLMAPPPEEPWRMIGFKQE